jgi:DNA-binding LytR/AlgR family response regulator
MVDGINSEVHFPLWLWNKEVFEHKESKANIYYGLFFGMLFFISFLSLITSLAVKKEMFLYYGLYTLFLGLYLFTYLGFSFQYIYPEAKTFNNYTRFPTIVLFVISLILFLQKFLEIKKILPKLSRYYSIVIGVFILNLIGWLIFTDYYVANAYQWLNLLYGFIFTVLITSFYAAYKLYTLQPSRTILFYIAFSFVFVGILLFVISQYGIIQEAIFPINPIIIGVGIEVLVLSIAMVLILKKMLQTKEVLEEVKTTLASENEELHKALKTSTIQLKSKAVLNVNEILYVKSDGHYMDFYLEEKQNPEIDRSTVNSVLELLPTTNFIRVHKSFIVNVDKIKIINSNQLMLTNGTWVKLSRTYKQGLKDILNKK